MGMVPAAIQAAIRMPTQSMIRIAGMAFWMLWTIPSCICCQLKPSRKPMAPVIMAAATSSTCALMR